MVRQVEERGSVYLPQLNAFYVREFQMMYAAEEAARFLHHACRGLPARAGIRRTRSADRFYTRTLEHALGYFGSRVLYPARPAAEDTDIANRPNPLWESSRKRTEASSRQLGYMLGSALRRLSGRVSRGLLRRLFLFAWTSRAKPKTRTSRSRQRFAASARSCASR